MLDRGLTKGSVTYYQPCPCEPRTWLDFYLCLGTEKPGANATGFCLRQCSHRLDENLVR